MRILSIPVSMAVLTLSPLLAQAGDYERLVKEYEAAQVDADEFLPRFQEGAERHAGTEAAVPFLVWMFENGGPHRKATVAALDELVDGHLSNPSMAAVAERLPYMYPILGADMVREHLDRLAESPVMEVQAAARYARAGMFLTTWGRNAEASERRAAQADLAEVVKLTKDTDLKNSAEAMRFEERNLQIGDLAPEIFGIDIDGVPFKLSDYRGKVVVLDFWGDW